MPVQIGAPTVSGGASTGTAQALSNWSSQRSQEKAAKNMQSALQEGQNTVIEKKDGKRVMPEKREALFGFIGGKTAEQYNRGLQNAYVLSVDRDNTTELGRIAQESNGDVNLFDEQANAYLKSMLATVDPVARDSIAASAQGIRDRAFQSVQRLGISKHLKQAEDSRIAAATTYSDEASKYSFSGDHQGAQENILKLKASYDAMVEAGDVAPEVADRMFQKEYKRAIGNGYKGELFRKAETDIDGAISQLDNLERPDNFTPEEWDSFMGQALSGINEIATLKRQQEADRNIQMETEISNLEIMSRTGIGLPPEEVIARADELFQQGDLSMGKRTAIISGVIKGQGQRKQKAINYDAVAKRLGGQKDVVLEKSWIDGFYDEKFHPMLSTGQYGETSIESAKANFVDRMKYVPTAMKDEISTYLKSDDPELITKASTLMDKIDEIPGITDQFGKHERALASVTADLMANLSPAEAVAKAREITNPANQAQIEGRRSAIKQLVKDKDLNYLDAVRDRYEGWFSGVKVGAETEARLEKEYKDLFDAHYELGMTQDGADKAAKRLLGRNWGKWQGRVLKHSPEKYYEVNGSTDYVQKQLKRFVQDNTVGTSYNDVILVADEVTDRTASNGNPAYRVMLLTDDGIEPIVAGETGDGHWYPDREEEIKKVKDLNEEKFTKKQIKMSFPGMEAL